MGVRPVARFVREGLAALIVTAAAAAACATMWWLGSAMGGGGSPAVLATVIALSLGRRAFASRTEFARSAALLPFIGLAAGAVGWLLVAVPPLGAALFVAGTSIPIWTRRFGRGAARAAALVSLPLTAVLVAPVAPPPDSPWWLVALLVLAAGVAATLWVAVAREVVRLIPGTEARAADIPPTDADAAAPAAPAAPAAGSPPPTRTPPPPTRTPDARHPRRRIPASTRMALQMAVALTAAFLVGWTVFPEHAMWVVLTAFLVCSGNRGRADVLHKSALRIVGALGGSVAAVVLVIAAPHASGFAAAVVIFVALFVGTWLRSVSYAFWALAVTLVLSLLQELLGVSALAGEAGLLAERMLAIVVGAALGIAASWFVLPVRSSDVLRRRLFELLAALTAALAPADADAAPRTVRIAAFREAVARVEELAPAHRATRMIVRARPRGSRRRVLPIDCIEAASALSPALDARLAARGRSRPPGDRERLRSAISDARRSLAAPADLARIRDALSALRHALSPPAQPTR